MKISELIEELETAKRRTGDVEVVIDDYNCGYGGKFSIYSVDDRSFANCVELSICGEFNPEDAE